MTILVIGDASVDFVIRVHHRPGADEKVVALDHLRSGGGVAANTAVALARLGMTVEVATTVGADAEGDQIVEELGSAGVGTRLLERGAAGSTYFTVALVDATGEKALVIVPAGPLYPAEVHPETKKLVALAWLHTVPFNAGSAALWTERARLDDVPFSIDLEPATLEGGPEPLQSCIASADTVFVNSHAADVLGGRDVAVGWLLGLGVQHVVLTLGEHGAELVDAVSTERFRSPAVNVVDTTGAGDAFAAAYIASRVNGTTAQQASASAVVAGALACRGLGARASFADNSEIHEAMAGTLLEG